MNYKKILLPMVLLLSLSCNSNTQKRKEIEKQSEYEFAVPKGWMTERIAFPIDFAPQINYTGVEDLRFTPGWEFITSEEHWTYAFVWWLDGQPTINADVLQENLKTYYNGLVGKNVKERSIPPDKLVETVASIKKVETEPKDVETYKGKITILDYLNLTYPVITLNCSVHKRICNTHTTLIVEISPQPISHKVWEQLEKLQKDFKCLN